MKFHKALLVCLSCFAACMAFSRPVAAESFTLHGKVSLNPRIKIYPERRSILPYNLDDTYHVDIRAKNSLIPLVSQNVVTDILGNGALQAIDVATLVPDEYDIAVKGSLHLRKVYRNQPFRYYSYLHDLTEWGEVKAGDTVGDNVVNVYDLNSADRLLYGNSKNADYNHDGIVNSLDISNIMVNFNVKGDQ